MELLASLVLDRSGIALQPSDVSLQQLVLVLQLFNLGIQRAILMPLALVHSQAIGPEHHVVAHPNR